VEFTNTIIATAFLFLPLLAIAHAIAIAPPAAATDMRHGMNNCH
jgi:hypothetical protein